MSRVTSCLTHQDRKQLSQLLGNVNLHLLHKASVHGFSGKSIQIRCEKQGPTLTVGYNKAGYIFGGYTSEDFKPNEVAQDDKAFLFRLCSEARGEPLKFPVKPGSRSIQMSNSGPIFGGLGFMQHGNKIENNSDQSFSFTKRDLYGGDVELVECEIYQVEDLRAPWRSLTWTTERRQELMDSIKNFKLYGSSVPKAQALLIGPVGGGKSSFINSANSVFRGYVTSQALAGSGVTTMYSKYSFREKDGKCPPLILCDTMGLTEGTDSGIHSDDIFNIIEGRVPNKYQFKATLPIQSDTKSCVKSVPVTEKIHCVVYVLDASKGTILSNKMEKKICAIRSQINRFDIPQIVLLTKVDKECSLVWKNVENVYGSDLIEKQVLEVEKQLSIPVTCIIPVKNYWSSHDLDCATDILILSALQQMLRYADSFLENLGNSSPA